MDDQKNHNLFFVSMLDIESYLKKGINDHQNNY